MTVDASPPPDVHYLALHFYPDGHVEAEMSAESQFDAIQPRFTVVDREKLSMLKDRPCLKEISKPFYGLKKPIRIN